ncbi:MAG: branched-chain amino acid ABC transporter ATP-binding protein/permease [Proteobacteria bacterium]|nr:branched-chain amino acid ABC transporter ATP-binding protein/permease [Pseudomonadota bacterium]
MRFLLGFAACAVVPWIPGLPPFWVTLAGYVGIAAIVALGLVVLTGVGGMTSFGQAAFMGFGAYTTALLTTRFGVSPWLTLPAALLAAGLAAALLGAVVLRLSGHYLPLGTLAMNVALVYVVANLDGFGRNDGINGIPPLSVFGVALTDNRPYLTVIGAALVLALLLTRNLLDSRSGRAIRALRGGRIAAAAFGVRIAEARMVAFVYAALLAGLAGWLYAHMQRSVTPAPFGLGPSIDYLLMAVIGGVAYPGGAVLGAAVVELIHDRLQDLLPLLIGAQGNFETIVFGAMLLLVLQLAPEGIWPHLVRRRAFPPPHPSPSWGGAGRGGPPPLPPRAMPERGAPLLEVSGLTRRFGGLLAVNDIGFAVAAGEIVGLIGPNGAGKSTTFNLLTGVDRPNAGAVRFQGAQFAGLPPQAVARRGVGRTFQHVKLVPAMSVIENVALGCHLRGHAGPLRALLRRDRAEESTLFAEAARQLARVGLADEADRPAGTLALGRQRIVEIARALALDPVLLLLDEPAAGLRHAEKQALAALLRRLRDEGMTILLVEHDMGFVMGLADRLVVMNFGTKLAEGPAAEVRRDKAVIAAYLGAAPA